MSTGISRIVLTGGIAAMTVFFARAGVVPVSSPFHAGSDQTDERLIHVGGSDAGGRLAIDNHAEFMVARSDRKVVQNWCNAGTFKWSFGFFSFDGAEEFYPAFEADLVGSPAVTFDGGDRLRMILEPGYDYRLPPEITDGVLSVELWVRNPSVEAGEVLVRFEDASNVDLTAAQFGMKNSTAWQHLVAVSDKGRTTFYKDNVKVGRKTGALSFSGTAIINLGAESLTGSIAAIRVHTEAMSAADIAHNFAGGVGLGTHLFHVIHETDINHGWWGDPERSKEDLRFHESAHFRSMWNEKENPKADDDIGARVKATQLNDYETVYKYLNERSGKHLPFVSSDEAKRGDGRKYKWLAGNGWGGSWSGGSAFGLGYGITYAGHVNPHEYIHGSDGHQMNSITGQWWEVHANFQVSWLGKAQANPVTNCPKHAHVYPGTGGNYYHSYLIWDHLVEEPEFGGLYVTRLWNRGPGTEKDDTTFPPKGMAAMDPSPETPFNHEWVKMAARNITWDYPSHPEYKKEFANQRYMTRKHFTQLEKVPYRPDGWFEPPKWRTPQQHGYNIAPLEAKPGRVTADLSGFIDAERGSDWTAMFVAIDGGTPRYGDIFSAGTQGSFDVLASDDELCLVVVATPDQILPIGIFAHDPLCDYRGAPQDRFPYQVKLTGATPKSSLWQPIPGMDGKIAPTAHVAPTAHIAPGAQVLGNARIEDYAQVYGTVQDNAVVSGHAVVESNAVIKGNARVRDYAIISGGCIVSDNARVLEHAHVMRGAAISGYGICKGNAEVAGPVHGNGVVDGNYIKTNDVDKGFWFVWSWGSGHHIGEFDEDFHGRFIDYQFEKQDGYRVWDTNGITWARLVNGATYVEDHEGTVLELDGTDDFVDLHGSASSFGDVSIVLDVKWNGGDDQRLLEFSNASGDVAWLSPRDAKGKLSFGMRIDGVEQVVRATAALPTGVWTNVKVLSYDDVVVLRVNDKDVASNKAFTHDLEDIKATASYLGRGASGNYYHGRIDNFAVWSRSLIDLTPPTPDPAEFVVEPVSVTETSVAMFAALGADAGGGLEYRFEKASGTNRRDEGAWQAERKYWDRDLDPAASAVAYRFSMRDGAGNQTDVSAVTRLTRQTVDTFVQPNDARGLTVVEAEDYSRLGEGLGGTNWALDTSAKGYLGTGAMMVPGGGRNHGDSYTYWSPRMDYFIDFTKTGNHYIWVRAYGSNPNADSYHLGLNLDSGDWGKYQAWSMHNSYIWFRKGPFKVDHTGIQTVNIWMREDGTRIDRFLVTTDDSYIPSDERDGQDNVIGDGPTATAKGTGAMFMK